MNHEPYREQDALFLVIVKGAGAEAALKNWIRTNKINRVQVDGGRLKIFDHYCLQKFQVTWTGDWNLVTIWDCWNKRHLYYL